MRLQLKYFCLTALLSLPLQTVLANEVTKFSPQQLAEKIKRYKFVDNLIQTHYTPLQQLKKSYSIGDVAHREWALYGNLKALSVSQLNEEVRQYLLQLTQYKSEIRTWMNDGGYQVEVTPWQIAAQAKGLLARWDILQARNFAIEKLAEGQWQEVLAKANGFQKQGYLQAISRTPLEAVLALGKKLSSQNSRSSFESRMLWGIALKSQNLNWMKQVAGEAGARFSTDLMRQDLATENLPNDNAVELLKAALKNSNLASFSLQRMAAYIDTDETVAPLLFDYLADKDLGSSAARALSQTNSVQVQQQLQKLSQSEQPLTKARAIQALDWHQQNNSK